MSNRPTLAFRASVVALVALGCWIVIGIVVVGGGMARDGALNLIGGFAGMVAAVSGVVALAAYVVGRVRSR